MVDFVGRHAGVIAPEEWDTFFSNQETARQQRWQNREARARYDEENRYRRDNAQTLSTHIRNSAGLLPSEAGAGFAGVTSDMPVARQPTSTTTQTAALPQTGTPQAMPAMANSDTPDLPMRGESDSVRDVPLAELPPGLQMAARIIQGSHANQMLTRGGLNDANPMQAAALRQLYDAGYEYNRTTGRIQQRNSAFSGRQRNELRRGVQELAGLTDNSASAISAPSGGRADEVRQAFLAAGWASSRGTATENAGQSHRSGNALDVNGSSEADARRAEAFIRERYPDLAVRARFFADGTRHPNGTVSRGNHVHIELGEVASGGAGVETGEQSGRGALDFVDASRPFGATREMQLAHNAMTRTLQRAEVAARHGRPEADELFAGALQAQAQNIALERNVALRNAYRGNMAAAEWLVEDMQGLPNGVVRFEPRQDGFMLQIKKEDGTFVDAQAAPRSLNELMSDLTDLVDAEGAEHRREAQQELQLALVDQQTRLRVASMETQARVFDVITRQAETRFNGEVRAAIAARDAEVVETDSGEVYVRYTGTDENGNPQPVLYHVTTEDEPGASTNGQGNTQRVTRVTPAVNNRRVTGTVGLDTGAN